MQMVRHHDVGKRGYFGFGRYPLKVSMSTQAACPSANRRSWSATFVVISDGTSWPVNRQYTLMRTIIARFVTFPRGKWRSCQAESSSRGWRLCAPDGHERGNRSCDQPD